MKETLHFQQTIEPNDSTESPATAEVVAEISYNQEPEALPASFEEELESYEFPVDPNAIRSEIDQDTAVADWPENPDYPAITTELYLKRLDYRLSEVGFCLDAAREKIDNNNDATLWTALKHEVAASKGISDPGDKVTKVIELENIAHELIQRLNVTIDDYHAAKSGTNKSEAGAEQSVATRQESADQNTTEREHSAKFGSIAIKIVIPQPTQTNTNSELQAV